MRPGARRSAVGRSTRERGRGGCAQADRVDDGRRRRRRGIIGSADSTGSSPAKVVQLPPPAVRVPVLRSRNRCATDTARRPWFHGSVGVRRVPDTIPPALLQQHVRVAALPVGNRVRADRGRCPCGPHRGVSADPGKLPITTRWRETDAREAASHLARRPDPSSIRTHNGAKSPANRSWGPTYTVEDLGPPRPAAGPCADPGCRPSRAHQPDQWWPACYVARRRREASGRLADCASPGGVGWWRRILNR